MRGFVSPTTRFKLIYALLFGAIGTMYTYLALYLETASLSGAQIGLILGMLPLIGFLVQPLWGLVSDVYKVHRVALACASFGVAAAALLFNRTTSFRWLIVLTLFMAVTRSPIGFLCDALALEYLESQSRREEYGGLRLWGSVGFAICSFLTGAVVITSDVRLIMPIYSALMVSLGVIALTLPKAPAYGTVVWWEGAVLLKRQPGLLKFLLGILLIGMTLGVANQYLIVYLDEIHAPGWVSGTTFALAGLFEVPLMAKSAGLIARWGLRAPLIIGIAVLPLRWLLYIFVREPLLMIPIQFLHSIAMMSLLVVAVLYVDQQLNREWRATGQALYQATLQGIGSSLGIFAAGFIYQAVGIVPVWWACIAAGVSGLIVIIWAVRVPTLRQVEEGARL